MRLINIYFRLPSHLVRRILAAGIAFVYGATNVVFCHAAEASFWSARRNASKKMAQNSAPSAPAPTDALILAQLPGGARLDFQGPFESSVIPTVPAKEHLVGGKVPVFASDLPRWLADVVTPYGNMRDVFLSKRPGAPLVIQIQDLHDSTEAQRNIAGLVEALQDERGISLVGLEGAQGAFATEAFRSFPDADITKAVAEHFMEEGYLGGPEFAGITAKRMPLLWGVEDMDGYKANVTAVKEAANNRPAVNLFLSEARQILDAIKDRRLSVRLLEFDKHLTGYHSRKEPLGTYVRYLLKSSPSSVAHVPNLVLLRDALHWEETLDFKRIEGERAELLERMVSHLSKPNLERLVGRSAMYRLGRISYGDYYRFLRTLCEDSGLKLDDYAQLSAYVRYVLLAERINRNDLLNELGSLERNVQDSLVSTKEEQRIVDSARHLALLERLVRHAYTPSDWVYHMTHESEILNVGNVIGSLAKETGTPHNLSPPTVDTLKPFEDFCLQALGRNGAMVKNLLEKMKAENRSTAVLVAGGFHTEGLTQLLRQKDISYAVVTPKVNGTLPDGHKTLDLLARDPAPLEKLFAGETVNIPTARMINTENIETSSLAGKLAALFVVFSLGLTVLTTNGPASSPAQLPSPLSAVAVPVPWTANAKITMGKNVFQIQWGTEGSAVSPGGYEASIPGYGITIMSKEAAPLPWGQRLSASVRQMKTDFDSKMSWGWLLGLMGLGTIRRVGDAQTPLGVSPPQPASRVGDSTSGNVSPTYTFSILSKEGMLLLAYENLLKVFPKNGLSQKELIDRIHQKQYLQDIRDLIRGEVVDAIGKMGADPESIITPDLLKKWVGDRRNQTRILTPYVFQKPATYSLLESWGNLSQSGLKKFFGRHPLWGTALLEEWGWVEKKTGLLEGRMPAALAGVGLGILAVVFSLTILQGVGLAVAGSFIWSMVGPQLKFVLDHGRDQTDFQKRVRMGGTFLLNLVAVSVSAAVMFLGIQFGVDGTTGVFASLSPVLGFAGAVLTHAIIEVLDILPDASSMRKPNFKGDSAKPSFNQDPLGKPLTSEEETAELIKKWGGKTIAELDEVLRVVADHDLGGSVNDLTNKHSVGVLGESRSVDVVSSSQGFSPYWWQRFWIKEGITQVKGEIRKGPGGDDYKMFFNESDLMKGGKSFAATLTEVIDAENDVMRDQFAFYSLEGPQFTNGKEEETAYLESIANAFEKEIGHWGRMSIVRHGNGVTIAVKREYPGEKLSSIENRFDKLGSWRRLDMTRPGLGLFTYSMGGLRLGDVVRRLTYEYPELTLFAEDGTLRPEMVPVVMMWADRLAEDMLAVAKGRGRKQVFIANDLADVYSFERPGTVTVGNIKQTLQENSDPPHEAFKVPKAEDFWKGLKKEQSGHVLIFEVAQYRKQGLRWGVNAISEWVFRHLPAVLFRFVPERWVRGLEKRIQSRAFHSWQGSDQHGKGNDAIKAHHEMVTSLDSKATNLGRAVDTFYSFSRGPPSLNQLIPAAETMRNKLATQHPDEKKKLHPFHVVYDFNLADWSAFLVENRNPGPKSSDRGQPRLSLEDVAGMQNAVVTYLGRRYGGEILLEKLREFFVVQPSEDVFLISMDVKGDGAKERFRKMELVFRKAQAENARAAKLVLNARPPIRMGSFFFSIMAKGVERGMKVSPARARQIVSGRYVQSLLVSLAELPFLPYLSIGFSLLVASVVGPWVGVIAGSFLMALLHGKPVMTRGPPNSLFVQKDQFGRPIESQQTIKQFMVRFLVALAINTFAIFVGGVDPTLVFSPQSLPLESLNLWNAGLTGYLSHALYNFVAPESYRLSLGVDSKLTTKSVENSLNNTKETFLKKLNSLNAYSHDEIQRISKALDLLAESRGPPDRLAYATEVALFAAKTNAEARSIIAALVEPVWFDNPNQENPVFNRNNKQSLGISKKIDFDAFMDLLWRWDHVRRVDYNPPKRDLGTIRNQMGVMAQGLGEVDPDQVVRLLWAGKMIDLSHAPKNHSLFTKLLNFFRRLFGIEAILSARQRGLYQEMEDVHAPFAERFGLATTATLLRDEAYRLAKPLGYAKVKKMFLEATGITYEEAGQKLIEFQATVKKNLVDAGIPYPEVSGRVKGIYSIAMNLKNKNKPLEEWSDLFGFYVRYEKGDENEVPLRNVLGPFSRQFIQDGKEAHVGAEYSLHKFVFKMNEHSPLGGKANIEFQLFNPEGYKHSTSGEAAHWIYTLQVKTPGIEKIGPVNLDRMEYSGDFKRAIQQFNSYGKTHGIHYVLVQRKGRNIPIRLDSLTIGAGRKATPVWVDVAAHGRVNILKGGYQGFKLVSRPPNKNMATDVEDLGDGDAVIPGSIVTPLTFEKFGGKLNHQIMMTSQNSGTRRRTFLMGKMFGEGLPLEKIARLGREKVMNALSEEERVKFITDGRLFSDLEATLLARLAKRWGFGWSVLELYAYMGTVSGILEKEDVEVIAGMLRVDTIIASQRPVRPGDPIRKWKPGTRDVHVTTFNGTHDRPRILLEVVRIFRAHGIKDIEYLPVNGSHEVGGRYSFDIAVKASVNKIDDALKDCQRQIPDLVSPQKDWVQLQVNVNVPKGTNSVKKILKAVSFANVGELEILDETNVAESSGRPEKEPREIIFTTVTCPPGFQMFLSDEIQNALGEEARISISTPPQAKDSPNLGLLLLSLIGVGMVLSSALLGGPSVDLSELGLSQTAPILTNSASPVFPSLGMVLGLATTPWGSVRQFFSGAKGIEIKDFMTRGEWNISLPLFGILVLVAGVFVSFMTGSTFKAEDLLMGAVFGGVVTAPSLPKRIQTFLSSLGTGLGAPEIFQTGIDLMNSCGGSAKQIKTVRDAVMANGIKKIYSNQENARAINKLQHIIEIRMVLADVKKQMSLWENERSKGHFNENTVNVTLNGLTDSWASAPPSWDAKSLNSRVKQELASIHLMGITLLKRALNSAAEKKKVLKEVDSAIKGLSIVSPEIPLKKIPNNQNLDLSPFVELGKNGITPEERIVRVAGQSALFGTDFFTPLVMAASRALKANRLLRNLLLKIGIEWKQGADVDGSAIHLLDKKTGLFKLTLNEILAVVRAAGFAVKPSNVHQNTINEVLMDIRLHVGARVPYFIKRLKVLETLRGAPTGMNEKEFAFFVRDSRNFLTIFVHENTLNEWKERGDDFYLNAIRIMVYHEWAESFGVSHEQLVRMELTIEGLESLINSGASQQDILWEIKSRGMLALGMRVPDERILNVSARSDAATILDALIPQKSALGIESYVTGQAYPVNADRSTYAYRVMHQLRLALPGLSQVNFSDSIRGTTNSEYQALLDSLPNTVGDENDQTASAQLELFVKEKATEFSGEGGIFNIQDDGKKFQTDLARDILARVFRVIDQSDAERSASHILTIKQELAILHHLGGSLFLSFSRKNDANRSVSPGLRRLYQERDLAWLDQLIPINKRDFAPVTEQERNLIFGTSKGYLAIHDIGKHLVGAFAALDDSLLEETNTPVIRISNDLLNTGMELTGPQRTALREVNALARRAEVDNKVAGRVVFLVDPVGGEEQNTDSLLRKLESRMGIETGSLSSLSTSHIMDSQGLFAEESENNRILRTFNADSLFKKLKTNGIQSKHVDIYSVPPTETLAEIWDISGMDPKAGLVLRLIELWASDVAIRVSSQYNEDFEKRMRAIKQSA